MIFSYVYILLIGILNVVCVYTDIKYGVIKNKILFWCGIPLIFVNFTNIVLNHDAKNGYYISVLLACIVGMLLYKMRVWGGGDFKFYLVLCLSLPYKYAISDKLILDGELAEIAISFAIGYVYILIESIVLNIKNKKKLHINWDKIKKDFWNYLKYFFVLVFINEMIEKIFTIVGINIWGLILMSDLLVVWTIKKIEIVRYRFVPIIFLMMDLLLWINGIMEIFKISTIVLWIGILFTYWCRQYVSMYNYKTIKYSDLKQGMILSVTSSFLLVQDKTIKYEKISDETMQARLSDEDVFSIIEWANKNSRLHDQITIVRKVPFAIFLTVSEMIIIIITEVYR